MSKLQTTGLAKPVRQTSGRYAVGFRSVEVPDPHVPRCVEDFLRSVFRHQARPSSLAIGKSDLHRTEYDAIKLELRSHQSARVRNGVPGQRCATHDVAHDTPSQYSIEVPWRHPKARANRPYI